jgi:hypothetical protein
MKLEQLLISTSARVTLGSRWLVFYDFMSAWVVYEAESYAEKAKRIVVTTDMESAIAALMGEEGR